jgi:general secretion pathway protein A
VKKTCVSGSIDAGPAQAFFAEAVMYNNYFGLAETPFSIAPDPRYLYMSERHREALAHLLYGINSEGCFVLLTGEVGTGKTTVCRCLLEQMPENCDVAFIFNPKLTAEELLATICKEFGIPSPQNGGSVKAYVDRLNEYLLDAHAKGRKAVLIIDEAQNLGVEVLEQMRLLTNLETNRRKLLQIILLGQTELREMVARPALRQLAQRITARYHLMPLSKREVSAYVAHRLAVSGARNRLFPVSTMGMLCRLSGGIPRLINVLCDRALLGVYIEGEATVSRRILAKAAREVLGDRSTLPGDWAPLRRVMAAVLVGGVALAAAYYGYQTRVQADSRADRLTAAPGAGAMRMDSLQWPSGQAKPGSSPVALSEQGGAR